MRDRCTRACRRGARRPGQAGPTEESMSRLASGSYRLRPEQLLGGLEIRERIDVAPARIADVHAAHQSGSREPPDAATECRITVRAGLLERGEQIGIADEQTGV